MTTVRKQKSGDQLAAGDWLAPGEITDRAGEVLFAHAYPASADGSRDNDGTHVQLVLRPLGEKSTITDIVSGNALFGLASEDELAEYREQADRAQKIADLRQAIDFLDQRAWLPLPEVYVHVHLQDDVVGNFRTVRELAEREGVTLNTRLDDRTEFKLRTGALYYSVIAWHPDGRPAEPEPDADPTGLTYSRADEADDPTPVSPARVPMHTGAVTDDGLVDDGELPERHEVGGDLHIEVATSPTGLTKAADESRGPLAFTTPVVTYFSFGHGQTDPDSGQSLMDHYVTVVAPTYEACQEAMFASRFGHQWSFDYLAGTETATNWISRWTEHEVIVAPGVAEIAAERGLTAAKILLTGDESASEAR